ncbi:MAG: HAMP domain-containing protein [Desulfobacteraceae bacterium]|nr:HAMP domain-containing protein [Desulfobacteraceae bacterium]
MPKFFLTIASRLTLWYAGIFTISSGVVFVLFYFLASGMIQHQIDQDLLEKSNYFSTIIQRNGLAGARRFAVLEAQAAGEKMIFFRMLFPNGEVYASSHMSYWKNVSVSKTALDNLLQYKRHVFETINIGPAKLKARILYSFIAPDVVLQTGLAMQASARFLSAFQKVFTGAMAFVVLFSALAGWFMARKALSGVETIRRTAENITGLNLEARVPESGNQDEFDSLAHTFNQMLDRIEILVKSIREMSDNIAHDLKSPITRIRGFAEITLVHKQDMNEYRSMAASTIEEADRLLDMINSMLVISRADSGASDFIFEQVNLSSMIADACELFLPLAEDNGIAFKFDVAQDIVVHGDRRMLQRAFSNLVDNAIKFTPEGGQILIRLDVEADGYVHIRVEDNGMGIEEMDLDKIFERFYRADPSRTRTGSGLGLSLAKTIVKEHSGQIKVTSSKGNGSVFLITLPYGNLEVI